MSIAVVGTIVKSRRVILALTFVFVVIGGAVAVSVPAGGVTVDGGNSSESLGSSASQPADVVPTYGIPPWVADHDGEYGDEEIVEMQRVTPAAGENGRVHVELSYHIGSEVSRMQVTVQESIELVGLDGFSAVEDQQNTYAWDQETSQPSIELDSNANETRQLFDGLDFVALEEWALTDTVPTDVRWSATNPDRIERHTIVQPGEDGFAGREMVYIGGYERYRFESARETFDVVVTDATGNVSVERIGNALKLSSEMLDVGARTDELTAFIVGNPIRPGGIALDADFWVHEAGLDTPVTVLWHEYVHTRQTYERTDAVEWTIEGSANYFSYLLALRQGEIQYHDFYGFMTGTAERYPDVVLGEPGTWEGTRGNYRLGSLVLAALDGEIRASSDGLATLEDVFRQLNTHGETVTAADFERFVQNVAGEQLDDFFNEHVRSTPGNLTVPPPSRYAVPKSDTTLQVEVTDAELEPGERGSIQFQVHNTGEETSLAPYLDVAVPTELNGGEPTVNTTAGVDSRITAVGGGWAFDHLEPGETLVIDYEILVPDVAPIDAYTVETSVTDLGGNEARKNTAVEVTSAPSAALVADTRPTAGETTVLDASGSTDRVAIETYRWEIAGSDGNLTETTEPVLEYAFPEPGEYTVSLTVVNELGRTDSVDRTVIVNDRPEASVDTASTASEGESRESTADDDGATAGEDGSGFGVAVALAGLACGLLVVRHRLV